MGPNDGEGRRGRGACLSVLMTGGAAFFLLILLVLATGGWAMYLLWVGGAIAAFGLIHYGLWGQWMLRRTAGEREEEEVRQMVEAKLRSSPGHGRRPDEPRP